MHQDVLCVYKAFKVAELLVLVVAFIPRHAVNVVKDLDADDGIDIEEEDEERHEAEDDRHDLKDSLEDILQLSVHLKSYLL